MASGGEIALLGFFGIVFVVGFVLFIVLIINRSNDDDSTSTTNNDPSTPIDPCDTYPAFGKSDLSPYVGRSEGWFGAQPIDDVCTLPTTVTDPTQFTSFKAAANNVSNQAGIGWSVVNNTTAAYVFVAQYFDSDQTTYMNVPYITDGKGNSIVGWNKQKIGDEIPALYSNMSFFFVVTLNNVDYNISTSLDGQCLYTSSVSDSGLLVITIALGTDNTPYITLSFCGDTTSPPSASDISGGGLDL